MEEKIQKLQLRGSIKHDLLIKLTPKQEHSCIEDVMEL